jgi:hypothetical protein
VATFLQALYLADPAIERAVSTTLFDIFGMHLRLDVSALSRVVLRVGDAALLDVPGEPRLGRRQFETYPSLDEQGDGLRSFATVLLAIRTLQRPIVLLDEPEAFLPPPQAYRLGRLLSEASQNHQLIIATHDTNLLRGILDAGREPLILRMTREGIVNPTRAVSVDRLRQIGSDALLQSARVLDGLFYEGVVVTEADGDRAFYAMIAGRLSDGAGIHFTNAHGKQAIRLVVDAYRDIGIPVASIVDLDLLRDLAEFKTLLEAHGVTPDVVDRVVSERSRLATKVSPQPMGRQLEKALVRTREVLDAEERSSDDPSERLARFRRFIEQLRREADPWHIVKERGTQAFGELEEAARRLLKDLRAFGLFLVPCGELEGWLPEYNLPKQKRDWIARALPIVRGAQPDLDVEPWTFVRDVLTHRKVPLPCIPERTEPS